MKKIFIKSIAFFTFLLHITASAQTLYISPHFKTIQEAQKTLKSSRPTILWDLHEVLFEKPFLSLVTHGIWNIENKPTFLFEFCKSAINSTVRDGLFFQWRRNSKITQSYVDTTKGYKHLHHELIKLANNMYLPNKKTYEIVNKLKKLEYNQYLFSNIGPDMLTDLQRTYPDYFTQFNQLQNTINPVTPKPDEWINKPNAQAYEQALEKIDQKKTPWMALFIDDKEENIKKAQELGMNAILFITPEQLQNDLDTCLLL